MKLDEKSFRLQSNLQILEGGQIRSQVSNRELNRPTRDHHSSIFDTILSYLLIYDLGLEVVEKIQGIPKNPLFTLICNGKPSVIFEKSEQGIAYVVRLADSAPRVTPQKAYFPPEHFFEVTVPETIDGVLKSKASFAPKLNPIENGRQIRIP